MEVWAGVHLFCSWDEFPNSLAGNRVETTGRVRRLELKHISHPGLSSGRIPSAV